MHWFRAMNTDVAVSADGDEAAIAARVAARFDEAERRFSRFRADSELSALNRAGERTVSPELFAALLRARGYVELTGGLFDPAVGGVLVALGYDRSFAPGALDRASAGAAGDTARGARFDDVVLEPATRRVRVPEGVVLDLGGMIKGNTVDLAAAELSSDGAIDAGGDAVVRGECLVDVEDPLDPAGTLLTLRVHDAAVATSAPNRRWWHVGDGVAHHLIDPRTHAPAATDLLQVTVVARTAELADVLAKTAFLLGSGAARPFLERHTVGAVLVRAGAAPILVGDLEVADDQRNG